MSLVDRAISSLLPLVPKPLVRAVANPYIAGETVDELIAVMTRMNGEGFMTAASMRGEFVTDRREAEAAADEYETVLETIRARHLDSNIHVKPTHLGLTIDKEFCVQNLRRLAQAAAARSNFVRIDMEDATCTDATLELHARLREEFTNVGAVIQACLRRSLTDVRALAKLRANVRLCKGVYIESRAIAYRQRDLIQKNFVWLLEELLEAGCYVGIATHDETLVWEAFRIIDRRKLDRDAYEFQMLLGVEPSLRRIIVGAGHRLRVAVPFGSQWYPYSVRRLRKNPAIARHVLRAVFSQVRWA